MTVAPQSAKPWPRPADSCWCPRQQDRLAVEGARENVGISHILTSSVLKAMALVAAALRCSALPVVPSSRPSLPVSAVPAKMAMESVAAKMPGESP